MKRTAWHPLPVESDNDPAPPCRDGDLLMARTEAGHEYPVRVIAWNGSGFYDAYGEPVDAVFIREMTRAEEGEHREALAEMELRFWYR
jgi:hypothetical protein